MHFTFANNNNNNNLNRRPKQPDLPVENSINKCSMVPCIGLKKHPLLSPFFFLLYLYSLYHHIQKASHLDPWMDLHFPLTISLPIPLSFSAATAAGFSPAPPTASSGITAVKPASSPLTAPFPFPVSTSIVLLAYISHIIGELCQYFGTYPSTKCSSSVLRI